MGVLQTVMQGDAVSRGVALLLLAMSVASWVVILWKAWLLRRAGRDLQRATVVFWQAPRLAVASCGARNRYGHPHPVTTAIGMSAASPVGEVRPSYRSRCPST